MKNFSIKILIILFLCSFFPKLVYANIFTTTGIPDIAATQLNSAATLSSTNLGPSGYDNSFGSNLINTEKLLNNLTPPSAPTGFYASSVLDKQVTLTWTSNTESDLTGYQLEYKASTSNTWLHKSIRKTATTFTVTNLASETNYNFRIKAKGTARNWSDYSETITLTTKGQLPRSVTGLKVSSIGTTVVDLTWRAASGATSYNIYRSTNTTDAFTSVGTSTTASYNDESLTASTKYYYKVSAVNANGEGSKSNTLKAETKGIVPGNVTGLSVSNISMTQVDLTWNAVSGATSYKIYRSTSAIGSFKYVGKSKTPSYTNKGLKANTTYYYQVSAVNANGEGPQSSSVCVTKQANNYAAFGDSIAYGLSASPGNGYVDLFYNYLKNQPENTGTGMGLNNLAVSGYTSSDLLTQLQESDVQKTINKAKVITISIGSNNLLKPTIAAVAAAFRLNPQDPNFATDLNAKLSDPANFAILLNLMSPENLPKSLTAGVTQFATDWSSIVSTIGTLAPNAQVCVMTLYNPLSQDNAVNQFVFGVYDPYIQSINKIIKESDNKYKVADVYPLFLNNQGDPVTGMSLLNPHPTDKGHNLIYQAHVSAAIIP